MDRMRVGEAFKQCIWWAREAGMQSGRTLLNRVERSGDTYWWSIGSGMELNNGRIIFNKDAYRKLNILVKKKII